MSLDQNLTRYRDIYESADDDFREAVNEAYNAAVAVLRSHRIRVNGLDPAENLVSAFVKFTEDSKDEPGSF